MCWIVEVRSQGMSLCYLSNHNSTKSMKNPRLLTRRQRIQSIIFCKYAKKFVKFVKSETFNKPCVWIPLLLLMIVPFGIYLAITKPSRLFKAFGNEFLTPVMGISEQPLTFRITKGVQQLSWTPFYLIVKERGRKGWSIFSSCTVIENHFQLDWIVRLTFVCQLRKIFNQRKVTFKTSADRPFL